MEGVIAAFACYEDAWICNSNSHIAALCQTYQDTRLGLIMFWWLDSALIKVRSSGDATDRNTRTSDTSPPLAAEVSHKPEAICCLNFVVFQQTILSSVASLDINEQTLVPAVRGIVRI